MNITDLRLKNQLISHHPFEQPKDVVKWLGAIQAQDYPGALWSIGLRLPNATIADIEAAIADRTIIRTWPMRGTLHIVAGDDIHWMQKLLNPRVIAGMASRALALELTAPDFVRCEKLFVKALSGGKEMTRETMHTLMESEGIVTKGQRGYHILSRLAMEGVLCFGSHAAKEPTFALLDEWAPETNQWERDESLAELALRYFSSHGPATVDDYVRWSGLTVGDARSGISMSDQSLAKDTYDGKTYWMGASESNAVPSSPSAYLLPGFDEYMLGYKNRDAALQPENATAICPGANGMFVSTVLIDGQVVGTWSKAVKKNEVQIKLSPFKDLCTDDIANLASHAEVYGAFIGKKATIS